MKYSRNSIEVYPENSIEVYPEYSIEIYPEYSIEVYPENSLEVYPENYDGTSKFIPSQLSVYEISPNLLDIQPGARISILKQGYQRISNWISSDISSEQIW